MELKRPRQTGTTSRTGDCLQHEAALNVQARNEYGALFDLLPDLKIRPPAGGYEVVLCLDRFKKDLPIATVRFGEEIPRSAFERAVRTLVDDAGACETILAHSKVRVRPVK